LQPLTLRLRECLQVIKKQEQCHNLILRLQKDILDIKIIKKQIIIVYSLQADTYQV